MEVAYMEIREYKTYSELEILRLYRSVGWTAYTDCPEHQRKGIGSALLQTILSRYSHVRQIQLATDNTPKTIAFYKSMGFYEFSEIGCCGFMKG